MTMLKDELRTIAALNYENGLVYMVNDKLYLKHLHSYKEVLDGWLKKELGQHAEDDLERFVIDVHALKSNSRSVGADGLFEKAAALERAGRDGERETVLKNLPALMADIAELDTGLIRLLKAHDDGGNVFRGTRVDNQAKKLVLSEISVALADFDTDAAAEKLKELTAFKLSEFEKKTVTELISAVDTFEYEQAGELVSALLMMLY